jgi:threonine synthase
MAFLLGLACKGCGRVVPIQPLSVCDKCHSPLEPAYDYDALKGAMRRETLEARPENFWRYRELYPLWEPPAAAVPVGFTPLLPARNLGRSVGHGALYIKNDAASFPSHSFKDRAVAVALNKAIEFGYDTVACSSAGNVANSLAAQAAFAGLKCVVFVPAGPEEAGLASTGIYGATLVRVKGDDDAVDRLCSEVSQVRRWAFLNQNLGAFYGEGSKSVAFETAEQLGWRLPRTVVAPMAGESLVGQLEKGFGELERLGWVEPAPVEIFGAQEGSVPIRRKGGPDAATVEGIRVLAASEGIFTGAAGGATVAAFLRLFRQGRISPDEPTVLYITENGVKAAEVTASLSVRDFEIAPKMSEFERVVLSEPPRRRVAAAALYSLGPERLSV